ncbi:unnamed protein product [Urochloa decumbens]|uniref:Uncharacterized protein n=1 Tax=Urochloa decumbens TaxID=240449 RepID=A0ABC8VFX6_9POAL
MAAAAARSTPSASVPAPRVAAAVLLLLLVLASTPCGGGARPVREGVGSDGTATSRARASPVLDVDRWAASGSAATAAAHRVVTVRGGAPTPPSGPSQNHN